MNMISNVDNDLNKFSEIVWIEKNSILPRKNYILSKPPMAISIYKNKLIVGMYLLYKRKLLTCYVLLFYE